MRSSCIRHPEDEPLIIIRQWQLDFCEGDRIAAALLSYFEYWHNIRIDMSRKNQLANDVAEQHGDERKQDQSMWQFHTEDDLERGVLIFKRRSINDAIQYLEAKGAIVTGRNPNPRYKFDRTRFFLFNPDFINAFLSNYRPAKMQDASSTFAVSSSKNAGRSGKNAGTIPEITTETKHPETTEKQTGQPSTARARAKKSEKRVVGSKKGEEQTGEEIGEQTGTKTVDIQPVMESDPTTTFAPPPPDPAARPLVEAAMSIALLTDPDVGLSDAKAKEWAEALPFLKILDHVAAWCKDRKDGKKVGGELPGPGALSKRMALGFSAPDPSADFCKTALYHRHFPATMEQVDELQGWESYGHSLGSDPPEFLDLMPPDLRAIVDIMPLPVYQYVYESEAIIA